MPPRLLQLTTIQDLLRWYELNLCNAQLTDPRGYRVRFLRENFVHLIQLETKYGKEPKNARVTLERIRRGEIQFVSDKYKRQRASELSWAREIVTRPDRICRNWQVVGRGDEAFVKNFATTDRPMYRVLVCEILGTTRQIVTIFPRKTIGENVLRTQIWP